MYRVIENFKRSFPFIADKAVSYKDGIFGELIVHLNDGSTIIYDDIEDMIRIINSEAGRLNGNAWVDEFRRRVDKKLRLKGLNRSDLCDMTGISYQSLSNYMSGRTNLTITNLLIISDALECNVADLIDF